MIPRKRMKVIGRTQCVSGRAFFAGEKGRTVDLPVLREMEIDEFARERFESCAEFGRAREIRHDPVANANQQRLAWPAIHRESGHTNHHAAMFRMSIAA